MSPIPEPFARHSTRLTLRLLRADDRAAWVVANEASRAEFDPWMPAVDPAFSMNDRFDAQLARATEGARDDRHYTFVGELRGTSDRPLVAFCSLSQVFRGSFLNAYAGWRVATPFARRGIGREAVGLLLDVAFARIEAGGLGLHRVQANVIPTNAASLALARAVGFREEGVAKDYLRIAGRWQDHVMLAKLADEHVAISR